MSDEGIGQGAATKEERAQGAGAAASAGVASGTGAATDTIRADLHVHTTVSDGSLTFEEALDEARREGVGCVAFTNHDTTRGLDEARDLGERYGVRVIGGIEISAYDFARDRKVHVLGYGLREYSPAIEALCAPTLESRDANSRWQFNQLLAAGYRVNVARAMGLAQRSTALYKQHIMAALTDDPYGSPEYVHLYRGLFKGEGLCARDITYVDARDAVRAIAQDGGIPVVAHPGQLDSYELVPELVSCGLRGIEMHHPDHTPADRARCELLAERFGLIVTGGSDYHGAFGAPPRIGYCSVSLPPDSPLLS